MARKSKAIIERDKEIAKSLFVHEGLTRKAIAERLGYTEHTVGDWVKKGEWDVARKTLSYSKSFELQRMMAQLEELNNAIESKEEGNRYPNSKEADIQRKLGASIRELEVEMNIKDAVNVSIELMNFLNRRDAVLAKELAVHVDSFLRGLS